MKYTIHQLTIKCPDCGACVKAKVNMEFDFPNSAGLDTIIGKSNKKMP